MYYLIINCHWDNRGDEAAIRAMIDEIKLLHPDANIFVQRAIGEFGYFPKYENLVVLPEYPEPGKLNGIKSIICMLTHGKMFKTKAGKIFYDAVEKADIVLHAPGGPSIGDLYRAQEPKKLIRLLIAKIKKKKYGFYAP